MSLNHLSPRGLVLFTSCTIMHASQDLPSNPHPLWPTVDGSLLNNGMAGGFDVFHSILYGMWDKVAHDSRGYPSDLVIWLSFETEGTLATLRYCCFPLESKFSGIR